MSPGIRYCFHNFEGKFLAFRNFDNQINSFRKQLYCDEQVDMGPVVESVNAYLHQVKLGAKKIEE